VAAFDASPEMLELTLSGASRSQHLCAAIADSGFLIERLVEPLPADSMRERWPSDWEQLRREPGFVAMRLVKGR